MKLIWIICFLLSNLLIYCQNKDSNNPNTHHLKKKPISDYEHDLHSHLIKSERTEDKPFLFDNELYLDIILKKYEGNCFIKHNSTIYDLTPLDNDTLTMKTTEGRILKFNICRNVVSKCTTKIKGLIIITNPKETVNANNTNNTSANNATNVVSKKPHKPCKKLAGSWTKDKIWTWNNTDNFNLKFPSGEICNKTTNETYKINMNVRCNKNATEPRILNKGLFDESKCSNKIIIETREGNLFFYIYLYYSLSKEAFCCMVEYNSFKQICSRTYTTLHWCFYTNLRSNLFPIFRTYYNMRRWSTFHKRSNISYLSNSYSVYIF